MRLVILDFYHYCHLLVMHEVSSSHGAMAPSFLPSVSAFAFEKQLLISQSSVEQRYSHRFVLRGRGDHHHLPLLGVSQRRRCHGPLLVAHNTNLVVGICNDVLLHGRIVLWALLPSDLFPSREGCQSNYEWRIYASECYSKCKSQLFAPCLASFRLIRHVP